MWHRFGPRGWFLGKFSVEVLSVRQESTKMGRELEKCKGLGNFLVVQWLGLGSSTSVAWVQSLVQELRFHKSSSAAKKKKKKNQKYKGLIRTQLEG